LGAAADGQQFVERREVSLFLLGICGAAQGVISWKP
jgi:hypothetical protein